MLVLVTYDVNVTDSSGQRRLRKVANICKDYGVRVQNSVFECIIEQGQYLLLKDQLIKIIDKEKDSIRFYRIGNQYDNKVEHYGVNISLNVDKPLIL